LKYESEIFVQIGAWKSLEELEDSLLLHELFLLYRACGNEYTKSIKASSVAFGGEVDFSDDWYEPMSETEREKNQPFIDGSNFGSLPISLGFETVE
jgi:hypothetical protein